MIVAGLLGGCESSSLKQSVSSATATDPTAAKWATRQSALGGRESWTLDGRVAVQRGLEGGQARIHWEQKGAAFELRIIAPLGQGTTVLHGSPTGVELETPDRQHFAAPDLATLMTTHLRWNLPVAGARYWIVGLPVPHHANTGLRLNPEGLLTDVAQDGWRISVLDYQSIDGVPLPRKLFLLGGELELRIVISQWLIPPH